MRDNSRARRSLSKVAEGLPLILWPLCLATLVMLRQDRPFRVVSDDHSFYGIALEATRRATAGLQTGGIWRAAKEFAAANSVAGDVPPHISRKRPLLLWIWSAAVLAGGDTGLVWTWRGFFVLGVMALFVLLARTSSLPAAAVLTGLVIAAPATQGLLSWMSCATFLVSYPLLMLGTAALVMTRRSLPSILGIGLLILSLLSREVAFLLVPSAVACYLILERKRWLAASLPLLAVAVWFVLPSEDRSGSFMLWADPVLFLRGTALVVAAHSASLVRNLGVPLLLLLLATIWPFRLWILLPVAALALLFGHAQLLLPPGVLLIAVLRTRRALPGLIWAAVAVGAIALYGHFSSRYAFEPLVGFALALGPAVARSGNARRLVAILPVVLWHTAVGLAPDALYRAPEVRFLADRIDQRFEALTDITRIRHREWRTFAGRVRTWHNVRDARLRSPDSEGYFAYVWRAGDLWRAGTPVSLHCPTDLDVVFDRSRIWEWNVWYWRLQPSRKGRGVHVDLPPERWSVHTGATPDHAVCLRVAKGSVRLRPLRRGRALREWQRDVPEVYDPRSVRRWLSEVWAWEDACGDSVESRSFVELELGRLLLRDDGWLDAGELAHLRTSARWSGLPSVR